MLKRLIPLLALSATVATASAHLSFPLTLALAAKPTTPTLSGQIMIKVTPGKEATVAAAYGKLGMKMLSSIPQIGWQVLKLPAGMTVTTATSKLKSISGVLKAAPDRMAYAADLSVNDPLQTDQYSLTRMQIPAAWDISTGSSSTIVAVLDTGVDYTHPDLTGKVINGRDFIQNDDDSMDVQGHGTHVAGSVGASTNNGVGVAGIGYNTKILSVRVLGDDGGGSFSGMAQGIIWAADHGANIINMSIQAPGVSSDPACDEAIAYANSKNVLLNVCAGNYGDQGNPRSYPGYNSTVVAVGASDRNDQRASFSMYNPANGSDNWVDVAAPGVDVLSTVMGARYENMSGTSMACPNTAGVASLIWSVYTSAGLTPKNSDIRKLLEESCDPIGNWINHGRVNAYEALLRTGTPVVDQPTPSDPTPRDGTFNGSGQALTNKDGISGTISGVRRSGVGLVGSFTTSFTMSQITSEELSSAKLTLVRSGDSFATLQMFMWDASKGEWTLFKAQPMSSTTKTTTINLPKATLAKYMQGNTVPVMFRSLVPVNYANRATGLTKIDQASITFTGFRRVAPGSNP